MDVLCHGGTDCSHIIPLPSLDTLKDRCPCMDRWWRAEIGVMVARRMAIEHFHLIGCPVPSCLPANTLIATHTQHRHRYLAIAHHNALYSCVFNTDLYGSIAIDRPII